MCVGVGNDVHVARRTKPSNCRVEMRVQVADADGAVLSVTDLNEAIALYTAVSWQASYLWTATQCTPNAAPRFKPRFKPPPKKPWFKPRFERTVLNPGFKPPCFCSGT